MQVLLPRLNSSFEHDVAEHRFGKKCTPLAATLLKCGEKKLFPAGRIVGKERAAWANPFPPTSLICLVTDSLEITISESSHQEESEFTIWKTTLSFKGFTDLGVRNGLTIRPPPV